MSFKLLIDKPQKKYFPDQSIEGRILYSVEFPHFAEVKAKLVFEEATDVDYSTTVKATASHDQLRDKESSSITVKSGHLDAGNHKFPFKVKLSKRIPSSYIGKYGHVRFFLKAWVNGSDDDKRYEDEVEFKVFSPIQLNELDASWLEPSTHLDELEVDRWCLMRDELGMEVKLARRAFVVGEIVNVLVLLTNKSHVNISAVKVKIFLEIQAKVNTESRDKLLSDYKLLASDANTEIDTKVEGSFKFTLKILPTAEIPNFQKCSHFTQQAILEVRAVLEDTTKKNLKVKIGLVLGHIPKNKTNTPAKANLIESMLKSQSKTLSLQSSVMPPLPSGAHIDLLVDLPETKRSSVPNGIGFTREKLKKSPSTELLLGMNGLDASGHIDVVDASQQFNGASGRSSCPYPRQGFNVGATYPVNDSVPVPCKEDKEIAVPQLPMGIFTDIIDPLPNAPHPAAPLTRTSIGFTVPVPVPVESRQVKSQLVVPSTPVIAGTKAVTSSVGTQVTPPPRYDDVFSTLKKEKRRLKRQEELAF